jgi:hypothetical protein
MASIISAGTTSGTALNMSGDTSGVLQLATNGTTTAITIGTDQKVTFANPIQGGSITSGTAVASTSGTSIDFTSLPTWVKRITVMFNEVSLSGTAHFLIKLGTSSGVVSTGYISTGNIYNNSSGSSGTSSTSGFLVFAGTASYVLSGTCVITLVSSNNFVSNHSFKVNTTDIVLGSGSISLGGTLDRVRITTTNGTDTFDAGSINILYEG